MELEKLTNDVAEYIHLKVERELLKSIPDKQWKDSFESLKDTLKYEVEYTKSVIEDFKKDGLKLNALETEGYLRGIIYALNLLTEREPSLEPDGEWL